jgi:DNA polymerase (family 10)
LRVVEREAFPFALLYFTGSKAHNIRLRARAQSLGYRLNEYGLFAGDDERSATCRDEREVYRRLGLGYVEPELREDGGEIEAAEQGRLPTLITLEELQGALHCHSVWSDGTATIEEMAEAARATGLSYLGLCDHSRAAAYAGGLDVGRVHEQREEIDALNARFAGSFRVLAGIEVDVLPDGTLDFADEILATFDLVLASVHSHFQLAEQEQTRRILRALDNPYVDVLGHPTGRLLLARDGYPLQLNRILDAAAERGIAVEINAHPSRLDLDWRELRYGLNQGVKTCINPDAHAVEGIRDMEYGVGVARKGWCTAEDALNAWPLDRLLDHLRRRRRDAGVEASRA